MSAQSPPKFAIEMALAAARTSPCAKSKRGVAIFRRTEFVTACHNAPPYPLKCTGTDGCRRDCSKVAIHAEAAALAGLLEDGRFSSKFLNDLELVHVKVVDGNLVAGGGPSCWQCSRAILHAQVGGIWLYESHGFTGKCDGYPGCTRPLTHVESFYGRWRWFCEDHVPMSGHYEDCPEPCTENVRRLTSVTAAWKFYTAESFHRETLKACGLECG